MMRKLVKLGGGSPRVLYANEFRGGTSDNCGSQTLTYICSEAGGRYTIASAPTSARISGGGWSSWGPEASDFVFAADARVELGNPDVTFRFRWHDESPPTHPRGGYRLYLDTQQGRAALNLVSSEGQREAFDGWMATPAVGTGNAVNRVAARLVGSDVRINVNGVDLYRTLDESSAGGDTRFGVIAKGDPLVVHFDNVLISAPGP